MQRRVDPVEGGRAEVAEGGAHAGSTLTMAGRAAPQHRMAARDHSEVRPHGLDYLARLLGVEDEMGSIPEGHAADPIVLDDELEVEATMVGDSWLL